MPTKPTSKAPKQPKKPACSLTLAECQQRLVEESSIAHDKSRYGSRLFDYPELPLIRLAHSAQRRPISDEEAQRRGLTIVESNRPENLLKQLGEEFCRIILEKDIGTLDNLKACLERDAPFQKSEESKFLEALSHFVGISSQSLPRNAHVPTKAELRKRLRWTKVQLNKVAKRCGFHDLPTG